MPARAEVYKVLAILAFVTAGLVPTLVTDFVPHDQWRAFNYALDMDGAAKWPACVAGQVEYFVRTGRPLVWIPECIEHALVHDIGDYKFTRLVALVVLLATMLIAGLVFRTVAGGYWQAVFLSVPVVLSPGFAFLYYQGATGAGVLAAAAFALASAYFACAFLGGGFQPRDRGRTATGIWSAIFFLLALFNYPAFAFVAFSAVFFNLIYARDRALSRRLSAMLSIFVFYGILCVFYFAAVKAVLHFLPHKDLLQYQFSVGDPANILDKVRKVWSLFFVDGRVLNFDRIPFAGIAAMAGAACFVPAGSPSPRRLDRVLPGLVFLLLFPLIALFGSLPLVVSNFPTLLTRHVVPGDFMVGFALFMVLLRSGETCAARLRASDAVLVLCMLTLAAVAIQQQRISNSLVEDSVIEVRAIRDAVDALSREGGWSAGRHIHVVRPGRVSFSRQFVWFNSSEYATATIGNLKGMFSMALRERLGRDELRRLRIRDCRLDAECGMPPPGPFEIVLTQTVLNQPGAFNPPWTTPYRTVDLSGLGWKAGWK